MRKLLAFSAAALLAACGSDNNNGNNGNTDGGTDGGTNQPPPKPTVGSTQIDRMGRPAINTALTNPFGLVAGKTTDQSKDEYNADTNPAGWSTKFGAEIATHLAIFDGLDNTCGNQVGASATGTSNATTYGTLAAVLSDDQLYVNANNTSCNIYLGVEADATGLAKGNGDCGGRTPLEDTIDTSYQVLATGTICALTPAVCAVNDGVSADTDANVATTTTFPFLGSPN